VTDDPSVGGEEDETCVKGYDVVIDKKVLSKDEYEASYSGTTYPYHLTGIEANGETRSTPVNDVYG